MPTITMDHIKYRNYIPKKKCFKYNVRLHHEHRIIAAFVYPGISQYVPNSLKPNLTGL